VLIKLLHTHTAPPIRSFTYRDQAIQQLSLGQCHMHILPFLQLALCAAVAGLQLGRMMAASELRYHLISTNYASRAGMDVPEHFDKLQRRCEASLAGYRVTNITTNSETIKATTKNAALSTAHRVVHEEKSNTTDARGQVLDHGHRLTMQVGAPQLALVLGLTAVVVAI
jgi:hypothetical protein